MGLNLRKLDAILTIEYNIMANLKFLWQISLQFDPTKDKYYTYTETLHKILLTTKHNIA